MTTVRRVRGIAAVLATIAAATLATTAQGEAHAATDGTDAATHAGSGATGHPHTTLRLHVAGCDRCTVQLQHAISGKPHVWTSKERRIGSDHVVRFDVRTSRTKGLSFVLRAPWEGDTGAVSNIVTRYAGRDVGSFVSRKAARRADRAEGCWAGTDAGHVRLSFRVARVWARTLDGHRTQIPLTYAPYSMASWKPVVPTFKGTIGNQDAFYCAEPQAG
jgi:hypothetical protein